MAAVNQPALDELLSLLPSRKAEDGEGRLTGFANLSIKGATGTCIKHGQR